MSDYNSSFSDILEFVIYCEAVGDDGCALPELMNLAEVRGFPASEVCRALENLTAPTGPLKMDYVQDAPPAVAVRVMFKTAVERARI
ncbi:hypothetical protein [Marinobacter shengliensis]|uniref:hypothetical protein n=1 Tax=Marinobacter shengliensis TaxID=1389223 RepID=UPI002573F647|nr:hypothetical protein [Marinobacter shengliensis]BEH13264.1 hypothetical protein MAALD49_06320 [Marinobacter shengliensis]